MKKDVVGGGWHTNSCATGTILGCSCGLSKGLVSESDLKEIRKNARAYLSPGELYEAAQVALRKSKGSLPVGSADRKAVPLARGVLDYFPAALAAVAELSKSGNDKHNPGEDLHWARGKSTDHADCIARHLVDRGTIDPEDGKRHSTKTAWRALALLQEELEAQEGAPIPRGARVPVKECPDNGCVASRPEPSQCDYPEQPIGGYFAGKPCPNLNCYFCRPSRFA